jgi:predicted secreted hydrolase
VIPALCATLLPLLVLPAPAFRTAQPGYVFQFPRDHGAHPAFAMEWWYFTGHLWSADGARRYGYQLTFFRRALGAAPRAPGAWNGSPDWRADPIFLAHAALTEVNGGRFRTETRLNRAGLPAAASAAGLDLRNGGWTARMGADGRIQLGFSVGAAALDLELAPATPPVVYGEDGVSRKGADPAAASHYLCFPRLASTGSLVLPDRQESLHGLSWMDHEFSSSQLAPDQVGWDWAGIQLGDGRSLMVYRLRDAAGAQDPWSTLTEVAGDGRILRTTRAFRLTGGVWRGPSGAVYPLPLRLEAWGERWTLEPLVADQELRTRAGTPITYWEGACRVRDGQGRPCGDAYVELTGYAHSMQGRF